MLLTAANRKTSTKYDLSHFLYSRVHPCAAPTMPTKAALLTRHSRRWSECRGNWALLCGLYLTFQRRDLKVGQDNLLEEQQQQLASLPAWLDEEKEVDGNRLWGAHWRHCQGSVGLLLLLHLNNRELFFGMLTDELQHVIKSSKMGCCKI